MENLLVIREFKPQNLSQHEWMNYHIYNESIFREFNPRDPLPDREEQQKLLLEPDSTFTIIRLIGLDISKGLIICSGRISFENDSSSDYETNKHSAFIYISVLSAYRKRGIALEMLRKILELAKTNHIETIQVESDSKAGNIFCWKLEGELVLQEIENRLYLEDVDWNFISNWAEIGREKTKDVSIEIYDSIPDEILAEFCKVYTQTVNQRPVGSMEQDIFVTPESRRTEEEIYSDQRVLWITFISRESSGEISGLTEFQITPRKPYQIQQRLTGVLKKFRGRGLGKRLKAEMLMYIKEHYPYAKYISTGNAKNNIPMLSINETLGFIQYKSLHIFKWKLADLEAYLKNHLVSN
jgi:GNAT superfamily N-acetyltransferase